jgi:glycosyltransferase involved in cell wall biosynthesis
MVQNRISQKDARTNYSLPSHGRIALAFGFATHTKGWDILNEMEIPDNWTILVNHLRNYYSKGDTVADLLDKHGRVNDYAIDNTNSSNSNNRLLRLNRGYLADDALSLLFYASDAVIMPYSVASGSGVMFEALGHGLPFVASDLGFFKEFARMGLGVTVRRNPVEFSKALRILEADYTYFKKKVEHFKSNLTWDSVAKQHVTVYLNALAKSHKDRGLAPEVLTKD